MDEAIVTTGLIEANLKPEDKLTCATAFPCKICVNVIRLEGIAVTFIGCDGKPVLFEVVCAISTAAGMVLWVGIGLRPCEASGLGWMLIIDGLVMEGWLPGYGWCGCCC